MNELFKTPEAPKGAPATELQVKLVEKAEVLLKLAKAQYKIVTVDGKEYGEWAPPATKPERPKYKRLGAKQYVAPYVDALMKEGDVKVVPTTPAINATQLQAALSNYACSSMGNGSATTHRCEDGTAVEIMLLRDRPPHRMPRTQAKEEPDPLDGLNVSGFTEEQLNQARDLLR